MKLIMFCFVWSKPATQRQPHLADSLRHVLVDSAPSRLRYYGEVCSPTHRRLLLPPGSDVFASTGVAKELPLLVNSDRDIPDQSLPGGSKAPVSAKLLRLSR